MLSIVIPAFNEEQLIGRCLTSIARQCIDVPFDVIVVDNNSTDATSEIAASFKDRLNIRVFVERRKGRGRARHTGWAEATGDIVFSTDADALLPPDWLANGLKAFNDASVAAITGPHRVDDCSPFMALAHRIITNQWLGIFRIIRGHCYLRGPNFAMRRSVYEAAGGFDSFADAHEDVDLSIRAQAFGRITYVPSFTVTMSGRRFKGGLIHGTREYVISFIRRFFLRERYVPLADVR